MKICTKLLSIQCILKVQGFTVISYPQNSKCCKSAGFSGKISRKISKFPAGNARTPVGKITPCATACPNRQIYTDFAKFKHNFSSSLFLAAMSSSSSDNVTKSRPFVRSSVPGLSLILSLKA